MCRRWRTIANGFYDCIVRRHVKPMSFLAAAIEVQRRHLEETGFDQKICIKSLDDYWEKIIIGSRPDHPFDFIKNQNEGINLLRKHCTAIKNLKTQQKSIKTL